jgi:CSLREA domain-containing protein
MTTRIRPVLLSSLLLLVAATPVRAFDVNSTEDQADAVIDGVCASAEGLCTLRAAVQEAEATVAPSEQGRPSGQRRGACGNVRRERPISRGSVNRGVCGSYAPALVRNALKPDALPREHN